MNGGMSASFSYTTDSSGTLNIYHPDPTVITPFEPHIITVEETTVLSIAPAEIVMPWAPEEEQGMDYGFIPGLGVGVKSVGIVGAVFGVGAKAANGVFKVLKPKEINRMKKYGMDFHDGSLKPGSKFDLYRVKKNTDLYKKGDIYYMRKPKYGASEPEFTGYNMGDFK